MTVVSKAETRKLADKAAKYDYLEIVMLRQESSETVSGNLTSWKVSSANSTLIMIDLEFDEPLYVSQNYQPDKLLV